MHEPPITELLAQAGRGERAADERLVRAVLARLEQIAARELAAHRGNALHGLTLEPGMLAHDVLLKVLEQPMDFENRRHFFAYASRIMVNALIDQQRRHRAAKRGGNPVRVSLSGLNSEATTDFDVADVAELLDALEALDARKATLVRLRVFWGASMEEIAELLEISLSSAERDWRFARRWLAARWQAQGGDGERKGLDG